jgi:hypothetical protein
MPKSQLKSKFKSQPDIIEKCDLSESFYIKHHGAVNGVTGSCHQLILNDDNLGSCSVLIDCGLFQGADRNTGSSASSKFS